MTLNRRGRRTLLAVGSISHNSCSRQDADIDTEPEEVQAQKRREIGSSSVRLSDYIES